MKIEQIVLIPTGDTTFKVSFIVDSHNLETSDMPNTINPDDVLTAISQTIDVWETERAESNIQNIKDMLAQITTTDSIASIKNSKGIK